MCDYSLMAISNRLAVCGEDLVVHRFSAGTMGLASASDLQTGQERGQAKCQGFWSRLNAFFDTPHATSSIPAVCIPPGAQLLVQDISPNVQRMCGVQEVEKATFTQVTAEVSAFRDAIRFRNGIELLVQRLHEGQRVRILALSSTEDAPKVPREREIMVERFSSPHR